MRQIAPAKSQPTLVVGRWRGRYLRFAGQQFVLLAAPARSGKGVGIVIPNLLSYSDSVVVLDIKQENFRLTAGFRRAHGQAVYLFNPFAEDGCTHRYNPLSVIADDMFRVGDILAIGYVLYPAGGHDEFWKDQARNLLLGLVLLLSDLREARRAGASGVPDYPITMGEVLRQSSGNGQPVKTYLNRMLIQHRQYLSRACIDALNRFLANDDKVLASILATFNASLTIWANPIVDAATSANDFDLRDVRRRKMSVYLGVTPDHLSEAAILMNLMFSQLVNLNTKELAEDNPALKYQCLLLLDEMTAIGKIHIIARAVAYMAGYNLRLLSIVQSDSQLESVYGRADARTIVTNHAMQILFAPREQKDANAYSEMLGTRTERSRSTSRSNGMFGARGGASESFSDQRRALMLPQEIKELARDKEIILLENTKPILADRICYWRDRAFTSRVMDAPAVPALDLVRFGAQIEQRLRELSDDDVDEQTGELTHVRADYLELVHAWDPRELPQALDNVSCEEVAAYVDRHFTLLGVPAEDVARAGRRLARGEDGMTDTETGARKRDPSPVARASGGVQ
ncbi:MULTISPECIES: type IV secretory system conjugative DNA transfer family protein [Burkholderia]|uniref:Type IV secretory system conjugative DNA transfer family protein n=1 Tax=Burkholderia cenocepacia TaxID=95486 RepID=A0ABD4UQ07_9BURK|nr:MULTISPECIES: type IV secretory system conjugative DNA transfer family protein [Burkholderia]AQQ25370.1 type IV secretion system protein VirD4 [Burkholderia cenocepacia]AQT51916.1 type IV secretion system protein VirD4 [Burkholderia cenocepacia]MCW3698592.1 type IV secretory system conjugative DNA transfer family protein [Burkholderia cenocepacia]MCW3708126.1 type IV secretory system conjugative DNA transfer family protein [Burkholderia cenocepacia]MCW3716228.1 type IV secretory system conj